MNSINRIDGLSIIIHDGHFDKIHYGLTIAIASKALDIPVTVFFTMYACSALQSPDKWGTLPLSINSGSGYTMDKKLRDLQIIGFEELISSCNDLDIKFMVCEMGLVAQGMTLMDLRKDISLQSGGLTTLIANAKNSGSIIFI